MRVRTFAKATEAQLFEGLASREIVSFADSVDHAIFDTRFPINALIDMRPEGASPARSQAHYCLEGHGICFIDEIGHLVAEGTVIAAPIGRQIAFEAKAGLRIVTILGTAPAEDRVVVRSLDEVIGTERDVFWGNGYSRRLLVRGDGIGFALCVTLGHANTDSPLQYRNHFESCYYVSGTGEYTWNGGRHPIDTNGGVSTVFVMDEHDAHHMIVHEEAICLSVFSPAIEGHERHALKEGEASSY